MAWFLLPKAKLLIPLMTRSKYGLTILLTLLVLGGGYYIYYAIDKRGYQRGYEEMFDKHTTEIAQLRTMYEQRLTDQARLKQEVEEGMRLAIQSIHTTYRVQIEKVKEDAKAAIDSHVDGSRRLSIDTVPSRSPTSSGTGATGACSGDHGTAERRELAPEAAEFLIREAEYATKLATQLKACQSTIILYRTKAAEYNERLKLLYQNK